MVPPSGTMLLYDPLLLSPDLRLRLDDMGRLYRGQSIFPGLE